MFIPGGMGVCWTVLVVVISHRPGFLTACAPAKSVIANRQQPMVIKTRVLCMISPVGLRQLLAAHTSLYRSA
jgi:glycogen debranching enzyme